MAYPRINRSFRKTKVATGTFAAALAIGSPFVADWEGIRLNTYYDVIGVATICYGHTKTASQVRSRTLDECNELLDVELGEYMEAVDKYATVPMAPETHAALSSFAFNVGVGAFRKSTLLRKLNAGDTEAACNELLRWKFAGGRVIRGLLRRRHAERELCLAGIT